VTLTASSPTFLPAKYPQLRQAMWAKVLRLQLEHTTRLTAASLIDARLIFFTDFECLLFGSCGTRSKPPFC
jgi:hypothetical protein